jgi:hypothetical protein
VVIQPAVDPPLASTIGFFMDDWAPRTFTPPFYKDTIVNTVAVHTLTVDASAILTKIPRAIAGHNANLWMSQLVTEPPFMTHIGHLRPHVIPLKAYRLPTHRLSSPMQMAPKPTCPTGMERTTIAGRFR